MRILIIDDEPEIRRLLYSSLENQGFQVAEAETGQAGLQRAGEFHPHLIVLDLGLPDMNGLEVLKRLREWTTIPILILTVSDEESTKVSLLDAGADDYLTKPFSAAELLARIRVGLRHHNLEEATPVFQSDNLEVDLNQRSVRVKGEPVKLTATEYALLAILVRNHGRVVSQSHLLKDVWGANAEDQTHYLRIYIGQLRKKLEADPSSPKHIFTEPGVGYRII
jgi:two-component system, OmpR family, KDP operon response regulator KdpE